MANLFDIKTGKTFAFIGKLSEHLSPETAEAIGEDKIGEYAEVMARAAEEYRKSRNRNFVTVLGVDEAELLSQANLKIGLTYCNPNLKTWKFGTPDRTTTYEVLTWHPGRNVTSEEVRTHFRERGFVGNTAAFIAWVTQQNPAEGYYASIPEDGQLWRGPGLRDLCAPCFCGGDSCREQDLSDVRGGWDDGWVFVAFRELPAKT